MEVRGGWVRRGGFIYGYTHRGGSLIRLPINKFTNSYQKSRIFVQPRFATADQTMNNPRFTRRGG